MSPKSAEPFVWGLGPAFLLPTATDDLLGNDQWGAGPTGVILKQSGPWTVGALANHLWSVGGNNGRETVNATYIQPFLAYTTHTHTTFTINSESTYDWTGNQWTVPFNAGVSQVIKLGNQPVSIGLDEARYKEHAAGEKHLDRFPDSIDTLSPNNDFIVALDTIPINSDIPYHTILGDRGRGDSPTSSDGVAPYWNSHQAGAKSELIVPSHHGAHQTPEALAEVVPILKENLRSAKSAVHRPGLCLPPNAHSLP